MAKNNWRLAEDYQGWTNWETWHTGLLIENEQELIEAARKLIEKYRDRPEAGEKALETWAIEKLLGPYNAQQIQDAQEWNDIPEHDRLDHSYEDFKEKHPDASDAIKGLWGGPDVGDTDPQIINPNQVNWNELFSHILGDQDENAEYERMINERTEMGLGWPTNHDIQHDQMVDAFYRMHGAKPENEVSGYNDPDAYHRKRVNIPFEHVQTGAGGYRWPEDYMDSSSRVKMWDTFGKDYEEQPGVWDTPEAQHILKNDPKASEIMQNGFTNSLSDHTRNVMSDISYGRPNPYIDKMKQALEQRGYTPEQIAEMMKQRWKYNPETKETIDLTKDYDRAAPIDKSLDQPGTLTLPDTWSFAR